MDIGQAIAFGGPMAGVFAFAIGILWLKLEAKERCKFPDKDPCGVCVLCKDNEIKRLNKQISTIQQESVNTLKGMVEVFTASHEE